MSSYESTSNEDPSLGDYLFVLRYRKWSIILVTVVLVTGALLLSFSETPKFEATASVLVKPTSLTTGSEGTLFLVTIEQLETERELATSPVVAELAAKRLGFEGDPNSLLPDLSVSVISDTAILEVSYTSPDPEAAQERSEAFAEGYLEFREEDQLAELVEATNAVQARISTSTQELEDVNQQIAVTVDKAELATLEARQTTLVTQLAILQQQLTSLTPPESLNVGRIIAPATLPSSPVSPDHVQKGMLGLLLGLGAGVTVAFIRERLDQRVRGREDVENQAQAAILALIPRIPTWGRRQRTHLVVSEEPRSAAAEAYRTLRTSLLFTARENGIKAVVVTSPHPEDGKTVTAANLSVVLAQAGIRVILLSADLRKPRLHRFFHTDSGPGLTEALSGEASLGMIGRKLGLANLRFISSGRVPENPAELLGSESMARLVRGLKEGSDLVIIDSAPLLSVSDTLGLAPLADAVLLVVDAERTTRNALAETRRQLDHVRAPILGVVLNNLDVSKGRPYRYYRYAYPYYGYRYRYGEQPSSDGGTRVRIPERDGSDWVEDLRTTGRVMENRAGPPVDPMVGDSPVVSDHPTTLVPPSGRPATASQGRNPEGERQDFSVEEDLRPEEWLFGDRETGRDQ